jgi:hypothetical protein
MRDPGLNNWDIGVAKTFNFTERLGFQLRLETFNTFNHSQYAVDTGSTINGSSSVDSNVNDVAPASNTNYGKVTLARPGRIVQLGGKFVF